LPYNAAHDTREIIEKLKEREADLRAQGVAHAALSGSVARGDDRPDSAIWTSWLTLIPQSS
jgi:predicted nucleotidyltransferase